MIIDHGWEVGIEQTNYLAIKQLKSISRIDAFVPDYQEMLSAGSFFSLGVTNK